MIWKAYSIGLLCFVLGAGLKSCILEHECKTEGKVQFNSSKNYECKESRVTNYYVYPDGTIAEEPLEFMSDDYFIIQVEDYEEAYETALMMGLI